MKEQSSSNWKPPPEAMLVLTKNNFTKFTAQEELIVVIFYASWLAGFFHVLLYRPKLLDYFTLK